MSVLLMSNQTLPGYTQKEYLLLYLKGAGYLFMMVNTVCVPYGRYCLPT
jgi:hypothetical protein